MNEREVKLFLAKVAHKIQRHDDMVQYIKDAVLLDARLKEEERNLFYLAYKRAVDQKRNDIQFISVVTEHQKCKMSSNSYVTRLETYKTELSNELSRICYDLISLVDNQILAYIELAEDKAYYYKMKADFYRYISESLPEKERKGPSQKATSLYEESIRAAKSSLSPTNPLYANIYLNYTVYLHEVLNIPAKAIDVAQEFIQKLNDISESNQDHFSRETDFVIAKMKANVEMWTGVKSD